MHAALDTGFITAETIDNPGKGILKNYRELIAAKNDPICWVTNTGGPLEGGGRCGW
jgi:hypothetical protein